ncbi:MAG TPA: glycosyltransferase [Saprospiraceae bacterium]|nr:glycosyltransferase [Saprospiraceae bacterium]HNT19465.1 glycosyltransferase [Saprospiraceae bacterium]
MTVLIVTFTYPPAMSVNGFRPRYFAKAMAEQGWKVRVLTRHFSGKETSAEEYRKPLSTAFSISEEGAVHVYRTPFKNSWFTYYEKGFLRRTGLWKAVYLIQLLAGRTCQESYNAYFRKYLAQVLETNKPDIILVESGPTNLVRLVSKTAVKYGMPYVIDFRDLYYHEMYRDFGLLPFNKKVKILLEKWYMRRSITSAQLVFSLNKEWLDILHIPTDKRLMISNGFDSEIWNEIPPQKEFEDFTISIIGTLYPREFIHAFLGSLNVFLQNRPEKVKVKFIAPGSKALVNLIRETLPFEQVEVVESRLPYREAIVIMAKSQILMYHGWPGYKCYISTKVYDYLRSGAKILIVPSDENGLDRLIEETGSGASCSTAAEGAAQLEKWYCEWLEGKLIRRGIDTGQQDIFSRNSQSLILVKSLRNYVESHRIRLGRD